MDGPLVTIGVPVFRGHEDLPTTLECLRTQTYASLDVLISVDGPGDPSVEAALLAAQLTEALMKAGTSPHERWHLWLTVADRFLMSRGGDRWMFCTVDEEDATARRAVLAEILERLRTTARVDLAAALETSWPSIEDLTWRRFSRD
jgi:hypothetical protein